MQAEGIHEQKDSGHCQVIYVRRRHAVAQQAACALQVSQGRLDIAAEGQTVGQAAASPQPQASFKTGEAAKEVRLLSHS